MSVGIARGCSIPSDVITSSTNERSSVALCAELMADIRLLVTSQFVWLWLSAPDLSRISATWAKQTLFGV